jgi:tetratricopeptide (TPR) repeat protein
MSAVPEDDSFMYDDLGDFVEYYDKPPIREESYYRDPESSALGNNYITDGYYPEEQQDSYPEEEDLIDLDSPEHQLQLLLQRIQLTTDFNEKIELQMERLALLKLTKGHVHVAVVRALLELSHIYIQSDALESALLHVEKSLKINYAIAEQLEQYEKHFVEQIIDVEMEEQERESLRQMKVHCDQMSNQILVTVGIIHYKLGNIEMSQVIFRKVQSVVQDILELKSEYGDITVSEQDEFPVLLGLALNCSTLGTQFYTNTERWLINCWELKEQQEGAKNINLIPVYYRLGKLYSSGASGQVVSIRDIPKAIEMYNHALSILIPALEKRNEEMLPPVLDEAHLRFILADLHADQGEFDQALPHLERAYDTIDVYRKYRISEGRLLCYNFMVWVTQVALAFAFTLIKCGDLTHAVPLLQSVIRENDKELHPPQQTPRSARKPVPLSGMLSMAELIDVYKKLGTVFMMQKQYSEALIIYRRACFLSAKVDQQQYQLAQQQMIVHQDTKISPMKQEPAVLIDYMSETTRDLIERTAKLRSIMIPK